MDSTLRTPSRRIHRLTSELADQIAAGEVVERPASVVKELVENAIDAGARRVEVELREAGLESICVVDDGRGIHPDDLELAVTRHATSKLHRPSDLTDIATLGFRGEALASVAAVAAVTIETRTAEARSGLQLRTRPGLPPERAPIGRPVGTRVVVARLFANVPARLKFMRSEATEVGHCLETMLRLALVHPEVALRLTHADRELLDLPAATLDARVRAILERRDPGPFVHERGELGGIDVQVWLGSAAAARARGGVYAVVRRRVVRDRNLGQIVTTAVRDRWGAQLHPVACLIVEPPPGTVDVNVHPQKSEVRFSAPQDVYTAVRHVLERVMVAMHDVSDPSSMQSPHASSQTFGVAATSALHAWTQSASASQAEGVRPASSGHGGYALRTRAASADYAAMRVDLRAQADDLHERWAQVRGDDRALVRPERVEDASPKAEELELLTCLPGPVALLREGDEILAIDLPTLRSHLVYRRLQEDLGAGRLGAQGLLQPVVVKRSSVEVKLWAEAGDALASLGLVADAFGDDALIVRAVPAGLRGCIDEPDVADLIERVLAWLRVRGRRAKDSGDTDDALLAIARTRGADPGPRLARRWCNELRAAGVELTGVPGITRWTSAALVGSAPRTGLVSGEGDS
jgi:DNA mismatch repair protein MutL